MASRSVARQALPGGRCVDGDAARPGAAAGDVQQERLVLGGADTVRRSTREPHDRCAVRGEGEFGPLIPRLRADIADDALVDRHDPHWTDAPFASGGVETPPVECD